MKLTINSFKECLRNPASHFSTISDAEVICDQHHDPEVWRNTNFAEAEIRMNGKRYILGMPLSDDGHIHCLRQVTLMNRFLTSPCITFSDVLIDEMMLINRKGERVLVDLLLHEIPDGEPLHDFAEYASREKLLGAIDVLEAEFRRLGIVHNNLTPHNVIVCGNYELKAIRYHYVERESEDRDCGEEFASLREWVNTVVDIDNDDTRVPVDSSEAAAKLSSSAFSEYEYVGNPFEDMICVADDKGYLYVDCNNNTIIEGRFKWASDFKEGRAEVETQTGMGLIDKEGNFVIEPKYMIVDYDIEYGLIRVRDGEMWALFNYMGEQILPFEERYIDDEDLEILSI